MPCGLVANKHSLGGHAVNLEVAVPSDLIMKAVNWG